jgi:hypothetical protein
MVVATALLDTLPTPSTNRVDKVYCQMKDILGITVAQQAESSLQCWAEVSVSALSHSRASQQKEAMELPVGGGVPHPHQPRFWPMVGQVIRIGL